MSGRSVFSSEVKCVLRTLIEAAVDVIRQQVSGSEIVNKED